MAAYSAKDVQKLRQMTGVGMLDAKNALDETGGDMDKAARLLREKGLASQAKRADRDASEGAVAIGRSGNAASIVQLRSETDFVAKSDEFVALVTALADLVAEQGEDAHSPAQRRHRQPQDHPQGEHLGRSGRPHRGAGRRRGRLLPAPAGRTRCQRRGRGPRRGHRGAGPRHRRPHRLRPARATSPATTSPQNEVAAERETVEKIARNEGKPDAALPKIVEGRLNGWYKERVLLDQPYVKDEKQTIAKLLGSAKVTQFAQVVVGD